MNHKLVRLIGAGLCLLTQTVSAETKYVTDDLNLALHAEEGSKGKLIKRLQSGTKLEILEESGLYAKVRTPDGSVGWTKSGFLMTGKPARARVIELEGENSQLKATLQEAQKTLEESRKLAASLRAEKIQTALALADHKEKNDTDNGQIRRLTEENSRLREQLQGLENKLPSTWDIPWRWGLAGFGAALLIGLLCGFALFDWISRRRHGGYRIY